MSAAPMSEQVVCPGEVPAGTPCPYIVQLRDDVREIKTAILGTYDKEGLVHRVKSMEKSEARRMWWGKAIAGSVIVLVLRAIGEMIRGG